MICMRSNYMNCIPRSIVFILTEFTRDEFKMRLRARASVGAWSPGASFVKLNSKLGIQCSSLLGLVVN